MRRALAFVMMGASVCLAGCFFVSSEPEDNSNPVKPVVMIDELNPDEWAWEPAIIKDASVNNLTLELVIGYRGGCADHDFNLLSPPNLAESLPPQHSLFLTHDAGGGHMRIGTGAKAPLRPLASKEPLLAPLVHA